MEIDLKWQVEFKPGTLTVDEAEQVLVFPYEDCPEELWPEYTDDAGGKVDFPRDFRHTGFLCPRPTSSRFGKVQSLVSVLRVLWGDEEHSLASYYEKELAREFAFGLIEKMAYRPDREKDYYAEMSPEARESLFSYLSHSAFLWAGVFNIFARGGEGSVDGYEYNDDEGFLEAVRFRFDVYKNGLGVKGRSKPYSTEELGAEMKRFPQTAEEREGISSRERERLDALVNACDRFESALGGLSPEQCGWIEMWKICSSQRYHGATSPGSVIHSEIWKNLEMLRDEETPERRQKAFFKVLQIDDLWLESLDF